MEKNKYWMLALLLIAVISSSAQLSDSPQKLPDSSAFIEKFDDQLALKLRVNNSVEIFKVNSDPNQLVIVPNTELNTKLSVNYRFIAFSIGYSPNFLPGNNDDPRKGSSKLSSFGIDINTKKWIQSLAYEKTLGFYLQNSADYIPGWDSGSDPYIQFPDLQYLGFSGLTGYKFNPDFSLRALTNQTERQVQSAGSFIPLMWYRYYIMDNRVELTGTNSSQKSNNLELLLQLGYFYTHVMNEKFYGSAGLAVGGGLLSSRLLTRLPEGEIETENQNALLRSEAQLAMGYNSSRFFAGFQAIGRWGKYRQAHSTSTIVNDVLTYQVFVGYRFNAPKALERFTDYVNEKRGGM